MKSGYLIFDTFSLLLNSLSFDRVRVVLLYSLFFLVGIQTGKHFWPDFAFVSGVRVDYLAPTLYFSDLVIFLLLIVELWTSWRTRGFLVILGVLFFLSLYVPIVGVLGAHAYGSFLVIKFMFVGYVVARYFSRLCLTTFLSVLSFSVLVVSLLGIGQFFLQSSFQGPFYYLGERAVRVGSIGAATFYAYGNEILRPYSTFPHPNVFAFFLFFACSFLLWSLRSFQNWMYRVSLLLGVVAMMLTFSRILIVLFVVQLLYYFYIQRKKHFGIGFFVVGVVLLFLFSRFNLEGVTRDLGYRWELVQIAYEAGRSSYLLGEGMLQYFFEQILYTRSLSPLFLQPVHNIFILSWLQLGVLGVIGLLSVVVLSFRAVIQRVCVSFNFVDTPLFVLLCTVVLVGNFDHYLLTVQQGQLLFSMILGMSLRKIYDSGDGSGRGQVVQ